MGELALIDRIRHGWGGTHRRGGGVTLGIGDDCALLRPPAGHELALTTDLLLEGRHFRRDWHSARSAGHRALARGLSDLAAMGARPMAAFLSLALPPGMLADRAGRRWVEDFFAGLRELGERFGVALAGGDTAESPCPLVLADIVLTGSVRTGSSLRRSGARPGDLLYVTGALGGAAAELQALRHGAARIDPQSRTAKNRLASTAPRSSVLRERPRQPMDGGVARNPQLFPEPRVAVGLELVRRGRAHAAIDLSDGLSSDLAHLCEESGVGAEIQESALPIHPLAAATGDRQAALALALHGGEDYELLFAAPSKITIPASIAGVKISSIGRVVRGAGVQLLAADGSSKPMPPGGWVHLS
jgi:thiamine-monophosphate kinase